MGGGRQGAKVDEVENKVAGEGSGASPCDEPNVFRHATEVRAEKDRRHPEVGKIPSIEHAWETIDDDFRVGLRGLCRCWQSECEPRNCDDPLNGLHDSRSEEHTSESSHLGISYAVFCLKTKK